MRVKFEATHATGKVHKRSSMSHGDVFSPQFEHEWRIHHRFANPFSN